jgi:ribosomal protein S18 acetylase RimI-like enzyme
MDKVSIRRAKLSDSNHIAEIQVKTWQSSYRGIVPESVLENLDIDQRTEGWRKVLSNPDSKSGSLVAEFGGEIQGFISVGSGREESEETCGEIYAIYVAPQMQGRGIGTQLLREGLSLLKEINFSEARLWVLSNNLKTRFWYEQIGWKITGKTKIELRSGHPLEVTQYLHQLQP